jgi:hypothetical protein
MPAVNVQFHMLFEELVDFVADVRSRFQLGVELERWFPEVVREIPTDAELKDEIRQFGKVDRFWLLDKSPKSKKAERFMLNVGEQRGRRLSQAHLGAGTKKVKAFEVLKKVAAELKRRTTAGAWVVMANGNVGYTKNERISEGATNASRAGKIDLVGIGFTCSYHVDPPETEDS